MYANREPARGATATAAGSILADIDFAPGRGDLEAETGQLGIPEKQVAISRRSRIDDPFREFVVNPGAKWVNAP
jgi:hypothetical protein